MKIPILLTILFLSCQPKTEKVDESSKAKPALFDDSITTARKLELVVDAFNGRRYSDARFHYNSINPYYLSQEQFSIYNEIFAELNRLEKDSSIIDNSPRPRQTYHAESASQEKWYEGGTLHKSKVKEYWLATEANRLATCSDFASYTLKGKVSPSDWESRVYERTIEIKTCIEKATKGLPEAQEMDVSEVAAACVTLLGYN